MKRRVVVWDKEGCWRQMILSTSLPPLTRESFKKVFSENWYIASIKTSTFSTSNAQQVICFHPQATDAKRSSASAQNQYYPNQISIIRMDY